MTELLLIFHVKLETSISLGDGSDVAVPTISSQVSKISPRDYCIWGWMKELVNNVKMGTRDALLGRILYAADRIRNRQRKLQRATRAVQNRAAACFAAGGGIFEI